MSLWSEISRRNVSRVTILYVVTAWLILQVADVLVSLVGLPAETGRYVLLVLVAGLPVAIACSWFFELTPAGLQRETASTPHRRSDSRRLDFVIIGILTAAVVVLLADRIFLQPGENRPPGAFHVGAELPTVAVLPFESRSSEEMARYFVDGMHDDIITRLSKIPSISVISRTSVGKYRGTTEGIPAIAEALGASIIIEGGVQKVGDRVRVNVQLIEGASDKHIWAETYDRQLTLENVFELQTGLAGAIAEALEISLSTDEIARIGDAFTANENAYELYVLARELTSRRNSEDLKEAKIILERAIEFDPSFALAHSELGRTLVLLAIFSDLPQRQAFDQARTVAHRSLELEPDLAAAHATLGLIDMVTGNTTEAMGFFERAMSLDPNDAATHDWFGALLFNSGRDRSRGLRYLQRAAQLDPLSPIINYHLSRTLARMGDFPDAERRLHRLLKYEPETAVAYTGLAEIALDFRHDLSLSADYRLQAMALDPGDPDHPIQLAYLLNDLGATDLAAQWMDYAESLNVGRFEALLVRIGIARRTGTDAAMAIEKALAYSESAKRHYVVIRARRDRLMQLGDLAAARQLYADIPGLLDATMRQISVQNFRLAIDAAAVLILTGERERALRLLAAAEQTAAELRLKGFYARDVADVEINTLRGETTLALELLHRAIESGWIVNSWWYLEANPNVAALRGSSEYIELEAGLNLQRKEQLANVLAMPGIHPPETPR